MLRKILSYGFVEGVAKALNKLTILVLPFFLDTVDYGKVGLLVSVELLLPLISLLGLERAVLRFYSNKENFTSFKSTVSIATISTHGLLLLGLYFFYIAGYNELLGLQLFPDLILLVILVYFRGYTLILFNMFRVVENHSIYFKGRLFLQISKFLLVLFFIFYTNSYLGYVYGGIASAILTCWIFKFKEVSQNSNPYFNKVTFYRLIGFSWPFVFHGIATNLLGNADKFIIEELMTLNEVGLYTLAYSIGSTMAFAFVGISVFMEPLIYKENNESLRNKLLDQYLVYSLLAGIIMYAFISFSASYLLPLFYNESYSVVFKYIPAIALSYIVFPFYLKSNYKLIYEQRSIVIAASSLLTASINIGLNFVFIEKFGIYGAVLTTLISYSIQAALFTLISNRWIFGLDFLKSLPVIMVSVLGVLFELHPVLIISLMLLYTLYLNKPYFFGKKQNGI